MNKIQLLDVSLDHSYSSISVLFETVRYVSTKVSFLMFESFYFNFVQPAQTSYSTRLTVSEHLLVDINNDNRGQYMRIFYSSAYQSFTPSRTGSLFSIELFTGSSSFSFNLRVSVTNGDARSGTQLGSASLYVRSGNGQYYNFTFSPPIPVTAGRVYSFGMDCYSSGSCGIGYTETNPYPGGQILRRRL